VTIENSFRGSSAWLRVRSVDNSTAGPFSEFMEKGMNKEMHPTSFFIASRTFYRRYESSFSSNLLIRMLPGCAVRHAYIPA
jgi:hypothetical protein